MTSSEILSSFPIDFMEKNDIVHLIRNAVSNPALRARVDIFVSLWQLTKAEERSNRGISLVRKGIDSTYNLIRSSVNPDNAEAKWSEWLDKRDSILAEAEEERNAPDNKGKKKGFRVQEKSHIEDVESFKVAFGVEDAVLLANLTDVPTWSAWPKSRKEVLLHFLDPGHGRYNRGTTTLNTKRSVNDLESGTESNMTQTKQTVIQRTFCSSSAMEILTVKDWTAPADYTAAIINDGVAYIRYKKNSEEAVLPVRKEIALQAGDRIVSLLGVTIELKP